MSKPQPWYSIRAADDQADRAEILIYDEIGRNWWGEGISAEELVAELAALEVSDIDVRINSIGGQVFEGLAIFNALQRHPADVVTHIDGLAASIASIVALAGSEVRMAENAFVMVHNPWGMAIGEASDMRAMADVLDKLGGSLAGTYMRKTGEKEATVRGWMDAETWFNATEAEDVGLVDVVGDAIELAAAFDLSTFANVPECVAARCGGASTSGRGGRLLDIAASAFIQAEGLEQSAATVELDAGTQPTPVELEQLAARCASTLARAARL